MRAFVIPELTGPSAGEVRDVAEPEGAHPWARGERLLIDVHVAGLAFPDVLQTYGKYQHSLEAPYIAGGEVAGVVLEASEGLPFSPGDRVASLTMWGGLAERVLGIPDYTVRLPDDMSFEAGAALELNYATASFSLYRVGLQAGETVVIHGASGGVGSATIQVARALGTRVVAIVSTREKEAVAIRCGADEVLLEDEDWLSAVRDLTGGRGADVVIDPVGGERFLDSLRSLDIGGRLAVVGFASGSIPEVKVNRLLLRDLSLVGVALAPYVERHPDFARKLQEDISTLCASGWIDPPIDSRHSLEESARALSRIESRQVLGKTVVRVKNPDG